MTAVLLPLPRAMREPSGAELLRTLGLARFACLLACLLALVQVTMIGEPLQACLYEYSAAKMTNVFIFFCLLTKLSLSS
jgi:hypothetical protein